jgi:hypothetical protein
MKYAMRYIPTLLITLSAHAAIRITKEQAQQIGQQIWKNECGGKVEGLTHWIKGEPCASLGIGHFIWYPKNTSSAQYTQTFPNLLAYFKRHGIALPKWLDETKEYCPWKSREVFFAHNTSQHMQELRTLLANNIDLQTQFIIDRLTQALPNILTHTSTQKRAHVKRQFYRVARSKNGLYALIDYINFKGEGINPNERYNNQGWGLLQVLEHMNDIIRSSATDEFAQAAAHVLKKRVENAPQNNTIDKKFLPGWLNRIKTYTKT